MTNFLSMSQLKAWISKEERLIPKQVKLLAKLTTLIKGNAPQKDLEPGTMVRILYRVTDNRFAITSNLNGDSTECIVTENFLHDIHTE